MFVTEYVRNCNCNYERIHLEEKPEERKYQYCILSRGGIRHLLPTSLRYINGEAYLYYDISSTQNVKQLFAQRAIGREWIKDFLWGIKQLHNELDRFLLDDRCIIWSPGQVFQDLEKNDFFFLYVPYYKEENGLTELMEYLIERVDYEDEVLVEFVYAVYERINQIGAEYLRRQIHEDWEKFERKDKKEEIAERQMVQEVCETVATVGKLTEKQAVAVALDVQTSPKKSLWSFWEGRSKKRREKEDYREKLRQRLTGMEQFAVCEETIYEKSGVFGTQTVSQENEMMENIYAQACVEEEYGKTIYIEENVIKEEPALYKPDGELATKLDSLPFVIGKKKENVNLAMNDYSVSRVHARITQEDGIYYIEDLNSTNGTFKNGLRLQPYEKRRLDKGDELRFGKTEYVYR